VTKITQRKFKHGAAAAAEQCVAQMTLFSADSAAWPANRRINARTPRRGITVFGSLKRGWALHQIFLRTFQSVM
jgi:hypothetical protein